MKPLVLALGNEAVPEDSLAVDVVRQFEAVGYDVDVIIAGTDLLRHEPAMRQRRLVVLVDVAEGIDRVRCVEHDLSFFDERQIHAHHLSAVQALELLLWADKTLASTRFVWVLLPQFIS